MPTATDYIIHFEVTEDDIRTGARAGYQYAHYYCPLAKAIKRAVGRGCAVGYGYAQIYWREGERGIWYSHSYTNRIQRFDKLGSMEPFSGVLTRE